MPIEYPSTDSAYPSDAGETAVADSQRPNSADDISAHPPTPSTDTSGSDSDDGEGKRADSPKPYVFHPNPPPAQSLMLAQYKDELNRHWAWEDFHSNINIDKFVNPTVIQDVQQAYRVLEIHLSYLASQLPAQTLAAICDANKTAEGRAFYGVHITRTYLHLEVYGGLVNDLSDRFERDNIVIGVDEDLPALAIAFKYEQLARRIAKPLEEYELPMHVLVFNYVFNIGAVAALHVLQTRVNDECLEVWMTIHADMLSLVRCHRDALLNCGPADAKLLRDAFDIETTTTLGLLDGAMRVDTKNVMEDIFGALPIPTHQSDSSAV